VAHPGNWTMARRTCGGEAEDGAPHTGSNSSQTGAAADHMSAGRRWRGCRIAWNEADILVVVDHSSLRTRFHFARMGEIPRLIRSQDG
jgi:hypothetical protein